MRRGEGEEKPLVVHLGQDRRRRGDGQVAERTKRLDHDRVGRVTQPLDQKPNKVFGQEGPQSQWREGKEHPRQRSLIHSRINEPVSFQIVTFPSPSLTRSTPPRRRTEAQILSSADPLRSLSSKLTSSPSLRCLLVSLASAPAPDEPPAGSVESAPSGAPEAASRAERTRLRWRTFPILKVGRVGW